MAIVLFFTVFFGYRNVVFGAMHVAYHDELCYVATDKYCYLSPNKRLLLWTKPTTESLCMGSRPTAYRADEG